MRCVARRGFQRLDNHRFDLVIADAAWGAAARLV